jgi:hypothetical protein
MLNTIFTRSRIIVGLAAGAALIVAASLAMGARLSTTIFVLALSMTPGVVIALLAHSAPAPSVAQILYTVTKDSRS